MKTSQMSFQSQTCWIFLYMWGCLGPTKVLKHAPMYPHTPLHTHAARSVFLSSTNPFKLISFKPDALLALNRFDYLIWQWISAVLSLTDSMPLVVWDQAKNSDSEGITVVLFNGSDKAKNALDPYVCCVLQSYPQHVSNAFAVTGR